MTSGGVEISSFTLLVHEPFLEALISLVAEPNGSAMADHACTTTREWWDEHGGGPTCDELLLAMFAPDDWASVFDDPSRTVFDRVAQIELLRGWLIHYWTRVGAIAFVAGLDSEVRPGRLTLRADS
ncbi:hypothetical protein [Microbacterium sp. CFBP9034]|uniref:hypothetical protein n=1 Tax=Microbacterium sp. CFBP9034 TaxID=3096540 RepID=UPI002A6ACD4D|nr:hypothetical protein [Microbacterium sp. CFBP9034]MDY0909514.1 hypothetical protein [Microbacterium sp. CFBP9034]